MDTKNRLRNQTTGVALLMLAFVIAAVLAGCGTSDVAAGTGSSLADAAYTVVQPVPGEDMPPLTARMMTAIGNNPSWATGSTMRRAETGTARLWDYTFSDGSTLTFTGLPATGGASGLILTEFEITR